MSPARSERTLARARLVMVVEDDDDLREVLCQILEIEGYEPVPHKDPRLALLAIANGAVPAAIILDYGLPGIGGAGFLTRLRNSGEPWSRCPVLLLTGWQNTERLGLAVDGLMAKPADPTALIQAIKGIIDAPTVAKGIT